MLTCALVAAGTLYAAGTVRGLVMFEQARAYSITSPRPSRLGWALRNLPLALIYPLGLPLALTGALRLSEDPGASDDPWGRC